MAILRTPPLDERIRNVRADIDAFINARVAEIRKGREGVPADTIRQTLTRGMGCECQTYFEIKAKDEAERAA